MAEQQEDLILDFGKKHRGESLRALALKDRNYVVWLAQQDTMKGSRKIPQLAARILKETAEEAKSLDEYDLDPRYRENYSIEEIEQMREWDRQQEAEDKEEERKYNEAHLVDKWHSKGVTIEIDVFGLTGAEDKPIVIYLDDTTDPLWEYQASHLRDLTEEERRDPRYIEAKTVAVLDNKVGPRIGLTAARKERLLALLTRYGIAAQ